LENYTLDDATGLQVTGPKYSKPPWLKLLLGIIATCSKVTNFTSTTLPIIEVRQIEDLKLQAIIKSAYNSQADSSLFLMPTILPAFKFNL
jgi:hypothetical protein